MKEKLKKYFIKENEDNTAEDNAVEKRIPENVDSEDQNEKVLYDYTLGEIKELKERFGDNDILLNVMSEEFSVFAEGRSGSLEEKYEAFLKLKNIMCKDGFDTASKEDETVLSGQQPRLHSGFSGTSARDASSGLTKRQMDMARSAGMSFREYEELLESVPAKMKNKF